MSQLMTSAPPGERVPKTFPERGRKRSLPAQFFESPVLLKWIMAISGIVAMGFVLLHMIGNLHMYQGPEHMNSYAEALRDLGGALAPRGWALWALRFGLIIALVVHLYAAARLTVVNRRARPTRYQSKRDYIAADFASRTMRYTGIWVLLFIGFHLATVTWGWFDSGFTFIPGDPYHNIVESLSNPVIAAFYIASMCFLSLHLFHGGWSIFQSLGINTPSLNNVFRGFAVAFALVILIGNVSFPVMIQLGIVSEDTRCWPTQDQIRVLEQRAGMSMTDVRKSLTQNNGSLCAFTAQIPANLKEYDKLLRQQQQQQLQQQQQQTPTTAATTATTAATGGGQ